jgi:uncharacterized protein
MKKIIIIIVIVVAGYFLYMQFRSSASTQIVKAGNSMTIERGDNKYICEIQSDYNENLKIYGINGTGYNGKGWCPFAYATYLLKAGPYKADSYENETDAMNAPLLIVIADNKKIEKEIEKLKPMEGWGEVNIIGKNVKIKNFIYENKDYTGTFTSSGGLDPNNAILVTNVIPLSEKKSDFKPATGPGQEHWKEPAETPDVNQYRQELTNRNYQKAISMILALVEKGDPRATTSLGLLYEKGEGVDQDYSEALVLYLKAAEKGYAVAQERLGLMYEEGLGVSVDRIESFKWYSLAAKQNIWSSKSNMKDMMRFMSAGEIYEGQKRADNLNPSFPKTMSRILAYFKNLLTHKKLKIRYYGPFDQPDYLNAIRKGDYATAFNIVLAKANEGDSQAQMTVAGFYDDGRVVDKDFKEAARWLTMAAEQGDAIAQLNLGCRYGQGKGVTYSEIEDYKWNYIAAKQGVQVAVNNIESARRANMIRPDEIQEAERLGNEWLEQHKTIQ